jgi:hypothetical protein
MGSVKMAQLVEVYKTACLFMRYESIISYHGGQQLLEVRELG